MFRRLLAYVSVVVLAASCGEIKVGQVDGGAIDAQVITCEFGDDTPCDDGDSCTIDRCTTANECQNEPATDLCKIDDECYADGASLTVNICKVCDIASDGGASLLPQLALFFLYARSFGSVQSAWTWLDIMHNECTRMPQRLAAILSM